MERQHARRRRRARPQRIERPGAGVAVGAGHDHHERRRRPPPGRRRGSAPESPPSPGGYEARPPSTSAAARALDVRAATRSRLPGDDTAAPHTDHGRHDSHRFSPRRLPSNLAPTTRRVAWCCAQPRDLELRPPSAGRGAVGGGAGGRHGLRRRGRRRQRDGTSRSPAATRPRRSSCCRTASLSSPEAPSTWCTRPTAESPAPA